MRYVGSKRRIAKEILPIILNGRTNETFVDLFCGGCNVIDKVTGPRIANDANWYLISMFNALQEGWNPPTTITEEEYIDVRDNPSNYPSRMIGLVGFCASYGTKWFGGYARDKTGRRDVPGETIRGILKQMPSLQDVFFYSYNYQDMATSNCIVYCDIPYRDTTFSYGTPHHKVGGVGFNHDEFWEWARTRCIRKNKIFVSEYTAPEDFVAVWQKQQNSSLVNGSPASKKGVEKLFVHESMLKNGGVI